MANKGKYTDDDAIYEDIFNLIRMTCNKDLKKNEKFNNLLNAVQADMKKQGINKHIKEDDVKIEQTKENEKNRINKHIKEDDVKMLPTEPEHVRRTRKIREEQQKCGIEYDNKGIGRLKEGITPEKYQDNLYKCAMDYFYPKKTQQAVKNITNKKHNQSNTKNLENNENIIKK